MREVLKVTALPGYPDEIGRSLWAMEELRRSTLELVADLEQATLDWEGPDGHGQDNSIGSLLYHIALVEMSWLYYDLLKQEFPHNVQVDFPLDMGSAKAGLTRVPNVSLQEHLGRLARSRSVFLSEFRRMTLDDWRRLSSPEGEDYEVTPEWVVFHLVEHEAGHAFQISSTIRRAKRFLR